jgi:hypothetical protein
MPRVYDIGTTGGMMRKIAVYLPDDLEARVRSASAAGGISTSALLREAVRHYVDGCLPPPSFRKLMGAFPDLDLPTRREPWSKVRE